MKQYTKYSVAFLLVAVILFSSIGLAIPASALTVPSSNWGTRDEVCTTLDGTGAEKYYTGSYSIDNLNALSGENLKSALKTLMTTTHKKTSSYDDCRYEADMTDCENGNGKITLIYTSYQATMSQWNGWNREHVWPKSLGGGNTTGGGADLHHIRPSDSGVNSSRGNKKYGEAGSGASTKYGTDPAVGVLGGYYNSTYFEPLDNVKGDVARICLYMYVRWGSSWGCDSLTEVFQSVDVLLEWCALDPVDTWEMGRNDVIEEAQGNRNVFIDYPELAWKMLGKTLPSNMTTPSSGDQSGSSTCNHSSTTVKNATSATCIAAGYTGDTYCTACGEKVATGTTIAAKGHTEVTDKAVAATCTTSGKTEGKHCTVCNTVTKVQTTIPALGHTWEDATCTAPKTCETCGATEGAPIGHNYVDGTCTGCGASEPTTPCEHEYAGATCEVQGFCIHCGEQGGELGDHHWSEFVVTTPPTATEKGESTSTCTICGETKTEEIPATGTDTPVVPPVTYDDVIVTAIMSLESVEERILFLVALGLLDTVYYDLVIS